MHMLQKKWQNSHDNNMPKNKKQKKLKKLKKKNYKKSISDFPIKCTVMKNLVMKKWKQWKKDKMKF